MKEEAYETLQMALLACAFIYFIGLGARLVSVFGKALTSNS